MKDWVTQIVATVAAGVVVWYLNEYQHQPQPLKNVENLNFTAPVTPPSDLKAGELTALVRAEEARLKQIQSQRIAEETRARLAELQRQREVEEARLEALKRQQQRQSFEPEMVSIPAGEFEMGSSSNEEGRSDDEGPVHMVQVNAFQMGKYEITNAQFRKFRPSHDSGEYDGNSLDDDEQPVVNITWNDAVAYTEWLSQQTGKNYRLPSEAEWEYAARAGTSTRFSFGNNDSDLDSYAWYSSNSGNKTHPVGQKQPNPWGLYDMHGNVWEWNQDKWHSSYAGAPTDGSAWESGGSNSHLLRGCSWLNKPDCCRSAFRFSRGYSYCSSGFRVVAVVSSP